MSMPDSVQQPPPFNDLVAANKEIRKLRNLLALANRKWGDAFLKAELTKRSLAGTIRSLESQIRVLKGLPP